MTTQISIIALIAVQAIPAIAIIILIIYGLVHSCFNSNNKTTSTYSYKKDDNGLSFEDKLFVGMCMLDKLEEVANEMDDDDDDEYNIY